MKNTPNATIALGRLIEDALQASIRRLSNESSLMSTYRYTPGGFPGVRFNLTSVISCARSVELVNAFVDGKVCVTFQQGRSYGLSIPYDKYYAVDAHDTLANIVADVSDFLFYQLTDEFRKEEHAFEAYHRANAPGGRYVYGNPSHQGYQDPRCQQLQQELPKEEPTFSKVFGTRRSEIVPENANVVTLEMNEVYMSIFPGDNADTNALPKSFSDFGTNLTAADKLKAPVAVRKPRASKAAKAVAK